MSSLCLLTDPIRNAKIIINNYPDGFDLGRGAF